MFKNSSIKSYIITGLLIWVPLVITLWVLNLLVGTLDQSLQLLPQSFLTENWLGVHVPGLGVILTVLIVLFTGMITANMLGQRLVRFWEGILARIPVVNTIYNSVKQVSDTLPPEIAMRLLDDHVAVFIPTTPSPVNGFYFYLRREDVIEIDMPVDVAFKYIVSMGVVATVSTSPAKPK